MATHIEVNIFDARGARLARTGKDVLLSVRDGGATTFHRVFVNGPTIDISTDFHNSPKDNHVVLASLKDHRTRTIMEA